jgi:hypothetical protein
MQTRFKNWNMVVFYLLALMFTFCSKNGEDVNTLDPKNLTVDVISIDHETGEVVIQASAEDAVLYHFYVGNSGIPVEENATGLFEYTFGDNGKYDIEVRAYGASGRYLKTIKQITIEYEIAYVPIDQGYFSPLTYDGYDLVWSDEFEGNTVNNQNWVFETGDGCPNLCGWGNNELQYYRNENAWVGDEVLTIEARKEDFGNRNYTSARLKTQNLQSFQYGRVDIRALLPKGKGLWPALWMLGNNISSVGWPACGEIDIMELIGGTGGDNQVHGTLHWDNGGHTFTGKGYTLSSGTFADEYHVFSIIWDENSIKWFVNDIQFHTINITPEHMTEFHDKFFFIFNVAVGGNWPGSPDNTTKFPQQMKVDYVRVFQQE